MGVVGDHVVRAGVHRPELLAPAGDWEALRAAVANGADAVYFGLDNFNARHRAANFRQEELPEIMAYLHGHNVKGFLTFNTLIFSDELPAAVEYVKAIAAAGVDAVIVQDLGLARLIKAMAPGVVVHGSTQMTLTEPRGIRFVRSLGVSRVVLARELSVEEIRRIAAACGGGSESDLEVFIHGALCVAYSGQCLTSESLGGRSANRGQCAQACRLPYELVVDGEVRDLGEKAYLLSPQDLAAYDLVGDLAAVGVASLKIEGRLKSAHYVAATTQAYREALDVVAAGRRYEITPGRRADLEQTFSRGFTSGFLRGVNHQELVAARFPKARGTKVGVVERVTATSVVVRTEPKAPPGALKAGDGVVFDEGHPEQDEQGGRVFAVTLRGKDRIEVELGRGDVNLAAIAVGALVWKTDDPAIRKRLEHSFAREGVARRRTLDAGVRARVGEPLEVVFRADGREVVVRSEDRLAAAQKHPVTEEVLREQLGRLGDTPYELVTLRAEIGGGPMVPKSVLNDLRRRGVGELIELRARGAVRDVERAGALEELRAGILSGRPDPSHCGSSAVDANDTQDGDGGAATRGASLYVLVRTMEQLGAMIAPGPALRPAMVYCDFEDPRRYKDAVAAARAAGVPIALATLRVVKPHEDGTLKQIGEYGPDAVLVRNLAAVSYYKECFPALPLLGDHSLNVANELTAEIFREMGLVRIVPSYDLNWRQLGAMVGRSAAGLFEAVVHQHMPMFHMEHCVFAHALSSGKDYRDCGRPCETHRVDLKDRVGQPHPLIPDVGCRNTVFNAQAQSALEYVPRMLAMGIRHFRVELLREDGAEVTRLVQRYAAVLAGRADARAAVRSLKVINQLGVTAGTLERE